MLLQMIMNDFLKTKLKNSKKKSFKTFLNLIIIKNNNIL